MQHPFPAANIASALIKSLGPYLDRCCVEHYPLETESYSSRLQFTKNPPSKPSSLKNGVDPHTSKFCGIIVKTFQPTHGSESGTNMRNYEVSTRGDVYFPDIALIILPSPFRATHTNILRCASVQMPYIIAIPGLDPRYDATHVGCRSVDLAEEANFSFPACLSNRMACLSLASIPTNASL